MCFSNYGKIDIMDVSSFKWIIDSSFDYCKTSGEYITSPEIFCGVNNELKWRFELFPHGEKAEFKEYLSLILKSLNNFDNELIFSLGIDDESSSPTIHHNFRSNKTWSDLKFCNKKIVIDKKLSSYTIHCKIVGIYVNYFDYTLLNNKEFDVLNDITELWKNEDFCDVTISVAKKEFHAHKAILASRSSVFATMFKDNKIKETLNIENIDSNIFEVILEFIYTDKVQDIEKIAKSVLVVADKYALKKLKYICINKINQNINNDNVIDILTFADLHNVDMLKNSAMDFIILNAKDIINVPTYKLIQNLSPNIFMELFSKYVLREKEFFNEKKCDFYDKKEDYNNSKEHNCFGSEENDYYNDEEYDRYNDEQYDYYNEEYDRYIDEQYDYYNEEYDNYNEEYDNYNEEYDLLY